MLKIVCKYSINNLLIFHEKGVQYYLKPVSHSIVYSVWLIGSRYRRDSADFYQHENVAAAIHLIHSLKGTVSQKLRHRLLYIIQKLFFILLTRAIKSYFYWRAIPQIMFKTLSVLSTMTLKLSENFEVFSWRSTFPLKIFCVHLR